MQGEHEPSRRLRIMCVDPRFFLDLLKDPPDRRWRIEGLPDDATVEGAFIDQWRTDTICLRVQSEAFDPVMEGSQIPTFVPTFVRIEEPDDADAG